MVEKPSADSTEARTIKGVKVVGSDLFSTDSQGRSLTTIASVFPSFDLVVTGRGIHAMLVATATRFLERELWQKGGKGLTKEDEDAVYHDAVSVMIYESDVLIRSDPQRLDRVFAADELLQKLVHKSRITFTGVHLEAVRRALRRRGECWRMSQPPRSVEETCRYVRSSLVQVDTGMRYYLSAQTGQRFLSYEKFIQIRPLLYRDKEEALARLKEIVRLSRLYKRNGLPELVFLLPQGEELEVYPLERLITDLEEASTREQVYEVEKRFDSFAEIFASKAGEDLLIDDEHNDSWRTTVYCRLVDIDESSVEECVIGLSPEFYFNVVWLPGARIIEGKLRFEENVENRVRLLMQYFYRNYESLVSINVGRIQAPQKGHTAPGERREVFVVFLCFTGGTENIQIVRMGKWDVLHRLDQGLSLEEAIAETERYRQYTSDRLKAAEALRMPIPSFSEIRLEEQLPGVGKVRTFFFTRDYVSGFVTNKIPPAMYRRGGEKGFFVCFSRLLGTGAAVTMVLGRSDSRRGHVFFDEGDEVIQIGPGGLPSKLVLAETTGSFADWTTRIEDMLPYCISCFAGHLNEARKQGLGKETLACAVGEFAEGVKLEILRLQKLLNAESESLYGLFADRTSEWGGIRCRWEGVLKRIAATDVKKLREITMENSELRPFKG